MAKTKRWIEDLQKYGKLAYHTGQQMIFAVNKRHGERRWTIHLKRLVEHGEDRVIEDD